jgi:hypothetical protein
VSGAKATEATEVSHEAEARFVGWVGDIASKTVPPVVVVELLGAKKYYAPAVHSTPRPDVAQTFGAPSLTGSGWDLLATFADVAPATYELLILGVSPAGEAVTCNTKKKIIVK